MPVHPFLTAVNAGEFSPKMDARIDFGKYPNGAKLLKNILLYPQGGWYRRPGTKYVASTKSDTEARLFAFKFKNNDSGIIEGGANYFRFYRRQAQITVANTDAAITNGTFTSDISGWDDRSTGSAAIAHDATNGRLQLTGSAGDVAWAEQDVTTTATGTKHVLSFKVEGAIGATVKLQVGSTSTGSEYAFENGKNELELGIGWHSIAFTPTSSPFYVQFKNDVLFEDQPENVYVDNISLIDNAALEVEHPYSVAELRGVRTLRSNDVVYFFHPDHPVYRLERRGNRSWSFVKVYFSDGPWGDLNPGVDLVVANLIEDPEFEAGFDSWTNVSSGSGGIVEWDDAQNIVTIFRRQDVSGAGQIRKTVDTGFRGGASTKYLIHYNIIGGQEASGGNPTNRRVYNDTAGSDILAFADKMPGWHTEEFTTDASSILVDFSCNAVVIRGGVSACYLYPEDANLLDVSGTTGSITVTALGGHAPFASTDVGRYLRFEYPGKEPGWGVITAFTSSTQVTLQVRREIPVDAPTESWRFGAFSDTTGYPKAGTFYEGRLVLGNTSLQPNTLFFSQSGDIHNMRPDSFDDAALTTEDDDALVYTLDSSSQDGIQWISGLATIIAGTEGGPWNVTSDGPVITATDRRAAQQDTTTIADMDQIGIGSSVVFGGLSRTRLFDLGYQYETNSYITADLTILADHVFQTAPLAEIAFQQYPFPNVYARRDHVSYNDGRLWALAYNRREDIVGWSRMVLGGSLTGSAFGEPVAESIATIPGADDSSQDYNSGARDELWTIVKRTIDGNTVRYIEFMEGAYETPQIDDYANEDDWLNAVQAGQADAFFVDSGITYSGSATTTITGLSHLEGEVVSVLADGIIIEGKTVSSGQITLDDAASKVHVGLAYETKYEGLKLPYGGRSGPTVMMAKAVPQVGVTLIGSGPFDIGIATYDHVSGASPRAAKTPESFAHFRTGSALGYMLTLYTGEKVFDVTNDFSRDPRVYIKTSAPLPLSVTGIAPTVEVQERRNTG